MQPRPLLLLLPAQRCGLVQLNSQRTPQVASALRSTHLQPPLPPAVSPRDAVVGPAPWAGAAAAQCATHLRLPDPPPAPQPMQRSSPMALPHLPLPRAAGPTGAGPPKPTCACHSTRCSRGRCPLQSPPVMLLPAQRRGQVQLQHVGLSAPRQPVRWCTRQQRLCSWYHGSDDHDINMSSYVDHC